MQLKWRIVDFFLFDYYILDQRPIIHSNKEGAVYARAVFTRLLRDVVFRDMIVEHLETAAVTDRKQHMEPQTVHFHHNEQIEDNGIAASAVVLNDKFEKDKAVEVVCVH